jgi:hypothetical protein
MANDTVVQYVLKVDAKGAQKGLDGTSKEADQLSKSLDKAGDESKGLNKDLKNTEKTSKSTSKGMKTLGIGVAAATAAMAAAITGAIKLSQKFADLTNELVDASTKTGIAVDTLAGLRLAAEGSGRSFSSLEGGLIKFQGSMDAANKGTKLTADAFKSLGVDVANADGSLRDADTVFNESIRALGQLENQTERNATAMLLFGRSGGPALIQSGALDNLENMTDLAKEFGVAIDKDAIGSMAQFQRSMAEFETVGMGTLQNITNSIAGPNSVTFAIQGASQAVVYMGSIFGTVLGTISQGFQNVIGLIGASSMALEGNVEGARIVIGDLQRETDQAVGDLGNIFQIASDELDRFNELSERSTAPQTMKNTGNNTQKTADEMERLRKATEEALKAQQELNRANDQMFETTSDLASQVDERLTSAYDKQLNSIKQLGGEIKNQIDSLDYELYHILKITDARKMSVEEQERAADISDMIGALEELHAENRIAEQKEILALLDEKKKKEQDILKEKEKQEEADRKAEKKKKQDDASKLVSEIAAVASLDASSIIGLINPIAGQIVGALETIGQTTPEEKRAEIKAQVDAIRLGISFLPEIFLELVPLLAVGILEAFYDGIILFGKNLVSIIKDAFSNVFNFRDRDPDGNGGGLGVGEGIKRFFDPNQQTFASGGRFIPKAQGGIRFTGMQDGLAMLHRGEFVVPQSGQRPQQVDRQLNGSGGGMTININSAVVDRNAVDALVREIEIRFNNQFGTSSSSLFGGR